MLKDPSSGEHGLRARIVDACAAANGECARSRLLLRESANLKARQWQLRLVRCGPGFRVMGMVAGSDERGRIAVRSVGTTLVLELIGVFDVLNAEDLQLVLEFAAERYDRVVVDVTETTFMDSAGVYALMHGRWSGLQVTIRGEGPALRLIQLMSLESAFELED